MLYQWLNHLHERHIKIKYGQQIEPLLHTASIMIDGQEVNTKMHSHILYIRMAGICMFFAAWDYLYTVASCDVTV